MIISLKKWFQLAKFLIVFVVLTYALYQVFSVITAWLEPGRKYREPSGKALKVFRLETDEWDSKEAVDRLKLFYWYGE